VSTHYFSPLNEAAPFPGPKASNPRVVFFFPRLPPQNPEFFRADGSLRNELPPFLLLYISRTPFLPQISPPLHTPPPELPLFLPVRFLVSLQALKQVFFFPRVFCVPCCPSILCVLPVSCVDRGKNVGDTSPLPRALPVLFVLGSLPHFIRTSHPCPAPNLSFFRNGAIAFLTKKRYEPYRADSFSGPPPEKGSSLFTPFLIGFPACRPCFLYALPFFPPFKPLSMFWKKGSFRKETLFLCP